MIPDVLGAVAVLAVVCLLGYAVWHDSLRYVAPRVRRWRGERGKRGTPLAERRRG